MLARPTIKAIGPPLGNGEPKLRSNHPDHQPFIAVSQWSTPSSNAASLRPQQPPLDMRDMPWALSWPLDPRMTTRCPCIIWSCICRPPCRIPCTWVASCRAGAGLALMVPLRSGMPGGIPSARTGPAPTARTPRAASETIIVIFLRKYPFLQIWVLGSTVQMRGRSSLISELASEMVSPSIFLYK